MCIAKVLKRHPALLERMRQKQSQKNATPLTPTAQPTMGSGVRTGVASSGQRRALQIGAYPDRRI